MGVDGINVVYGKPLGDNSNEIGYILDAGQITLIKGYRIDDVNVAQFKFTEADKSYANVTKKMGGKTTGVISAKVYTEKVKAFDYEKELAKIHKRLDEQKDNKEYIPYPIYPKRDPWYDEWPYQKPWITWTSPTVWGLSNSQVTYTCASNNVGGTILNNPTCNYSQVVGLDESYNQSLNSSIEPAHDTVNAFTLGGSWGKKTEQQIKEITFETGNLLCNLVMYYAAKVGLESLGVEMKKLPKISKRPEPFPAAQTKYCSVPSGWTG